MIYRNILWMLSTTLLLAYFTATADTLDKVLVVVNDEAITKNEYLARYRRHLLEVGSSAKQIKQKIKAPYDRQVLDLLVTETLLKQYAKRLRIMVDSEEIEDTIQLLAKQNGKSKADFLQLVVDAEIPAQQFRMDISDQLIIRKLIDFEINTRVIVTPKEIEDYLNTNKVPVNDSKVFRISHLVINLPENADKSTKQIKRAQIEQIRREILNGLSFKQAVKLYSDGSTKDGGYLGERKPSQLPALFLKYIKATKPGSITQVIESPNGFHLLYVHSVKGENTIVRQQHVRHILVRQDPDLTESELKQKAENIYKRLLKNEPFESVARIYSDDGQSSMNGGDLGWITRGEVTPVFEKAALKLAVKELSKPVRTHYGYHVIQVLGRRKHDIRAEKASFNARKSIYQRKASEQYKQWVSALRNNTYIEYIGASDG